jgi:hypothetical protein
LLIFGDYLLIFGAAVDWLSFYGFKRGSLTGGILVGDAVEDSFLPASPLKMP